MDSLLHFKSTDRIRACIADILRASETTDSTSEKRSTSFILTSEDKQRLEQLRSSTTVPFPVAQKLVRLAKEIPSDTLSDSNCVLLRHLLNGSTVVHERPARMVRQQERMQSKQYLESMDRARAAQSNLEYSKITASVRPETKWNLGLSQLRDLNSQMSLGVNLIVSMASVFIACYFTFYYGFGDHILVGEVIGDDKREARR
jgi:hypothetical protein